MQTLIIQTMNAAVDFVLIVPGLKFHHGRASRYIHRRESKNSETKHNFIYTYQQHRATRYLSG